MSERTRHSLSIVGVLLWLAFPFAYADGAHARWERQCSGRTFTGRFDDCFNDALPVLEWFAFPVTVALLYLFARFAFSIFAPPKAERTLKWRLAGSGSGAESFPVFQIFAGIGIVWALLHLHSLALRAVYWHLIAYWMGWLVWLAAGAVASLPSRRPDAS